MAVSRTPRLDAVQTWLDGGRQGPIEYTERWPDPEAWTDRAVRLEAALTMASSGVRAELPPRPNVRGSDIGPPPRRPRRWLKRRTP